jgi:hypothetical protein
MAGAAHDQLLTYMNGAYTEIEHAYDPITNNASLSPITTRLQKVIIDLSGNICRNDNLKQEKQALTQMSIDMKNVIEQYNIFKKMRKELYDSLASYQKEVDEINTLHENSFTNINKLVHTLLMDEFDLSNKESSPETNKFMALENTLRKCQTDIFLSVNDYKQKRSNQMDKIKESLKETTDNLAVLSRGLSFGIKEAYGEEAPSTIETTTCFICATDPIDHAFNPCGHTACKKCADHILERKKCHMCERNVNSVIKLYIG